jgi:hypothetical protein
MWTKRALAVGRLQVPIASTSCSPSSRPQLLAPDVPIEEAPVPHMFSTYNGNGLPIDSITVIAKQGLYVPPTGIPVAMTQYSGQALLNEV